MLGFCWRHCRRYNRRHKEVDRALGIGAKGSRIAAFLATVHSSSVGADPSLSGGATGLANADASTADASTAEANLAGANASPAANEATLMGNFSVGLSGYR